MQANPTLEHLRVRRQTRRVWIVLFAATLVFALIASGVVAAARFYYGHATQREAATLQVISGSGALVRSSPVSEWRLVSGTTTIHEGDEISTALGTVAWLTIFDGSTVEVSEDTIVRIARMRSSRFLHRTKHVILEPQRGTIYVGVAPHGDYNYTEFSARYGATSVTMSDESGRNDAGSFLVEVIPGASDGDAEGTPLIRIGVLRGAATLATSAMRQKLTANQQTIVQDDGTIGSITEAVRQLLQNGTFSQGMGGWVDFQQQSQRSAGVIASGASVELVSETIDGRQANAVEFLRGANQDDDVQAGIRQRIGQTLRVYSSLILQFDVRIRDQRPLGGGAELTDYPLIVQLNYIDIEGQEREWWHGYYVLENPGHPAPSDRATRIDLDQWQHIAFDLRSLSPLPRQITSIVVYASGQSYQTRVANLSLTSSELAQSGP